MGFSKPVDLPEHGESGLVFVLIFEILKLDLVAQCVQNDPLRPGSILFGPYLELLWDPKVLGKFFYTKFYTSIDL